MPYNFVADSFHRTKLHIRLSSSAVRFYTEIGRFAFLSPRLIGGLRGYVHNHLRLIGKRVVDFLLMLGVTAKALRANIGSKSAVSLQRTPVTHNFR